MPLQSGRKKQQLCIKPECSAQTVPLPVSREMLLQLCFLVLLSERSAVCTEFSPRDEDVGAKWFCAMNPHLYIYERLVVWMWD